MEVREIIIKLKLLVEHLERMMDRENESSNVNILKEDVKVLNEVIERLNDECSGKDAAKIIKHLMEVENVNQKELAIKMGCVRQNVSQMLNRGTVNMRYDSFYRMADALGYEIVLRKNEINLHFEK